MIVVDASLLVRALIDRGQLGEACRAVLAADQEWVAPSHQLAEVMSALRGHVLGRKLSDADVAQAFGELKRLRSRSIDLIGLMDRMWELRANATPYDAAYVAAAELLGSTLVTTDAKFAGIPGIRCRVQVVDAPT